MKQRIQELIDQSYTEVMHERGGRYMAFDKEKFAELIIEEICKLIRDNEFKHLPHHLHRMSAYAEEQMIKEHFGVTE